LPIRVQGGGEAVAGGAGDGETSIERVRKRGEVAFSALYGRGCLRGTPCRSVLGAPRGRAGVLERARALYMRIHVFL
jgi:hypothetical protein